MKRLLRLFVGLLYLFTLGCPFVFAIETCTTEIVEGMPVEHCTSDSDSSEPSGETPKECPNGCCGIKLNTNFPIIGNCIGDDADEDATNAFPTMTKALAKIVVSLILVVCFILVIYAGILRAMDKPKDATEWLKRVAITILLLGFSGVILRLINPNFFG